MNECVFLSAFLSRCRMRLAPCVPNCIVPFVATTSFFFCHHLSLCLRAECAHDGKRNLALPQLPYHLGKHTKCRLLHLNDVVDKWRGHEVDPLGVSSQDFSTGFNLVLDLPEEMHLTILDCVALVVYILTFLLGLPANLLVLFVYTRKARKHGATPNVVYALNLCLANLGLLVWLPVKALETLVQDWRLPAPVCPVYSFFLYSSLYGSCLFITAVTVGRYVSIAFPIIYKRWRCARNTCIISAVLWLLVLLHLSPALVAEGGAFFVSTGNNTSCYEVFSESQLAVLLPLRLEMAIVLFLLPLIVTSFCTTRCVTLVWRSKLSPMGKRRVLVIALSTLAVFVVCYAPYNASHIVGFVTDQNVTWRTYAMLTSTCNVFLDPVVMLMFSPVASKGVLGRICGRQSQFSHREGSRYRCKPVSGAAEVRAPTVPSEGSKAGAKEMTKGCQE